VAQLNRKLRLRKSWALAGAAPIVQMPENANKTKFSSMIAATAAHSG
jgi:hypothetical protein